MLISQDIGYRSECSEFTETKCRTVFDTKEGLELKRNYKNIKMILNRSQSACQMSNVFNVQPLSQSEEKCSVSYRKQCDMVYETVTDLGWFYPAGNEF